jgi:uncharacterized protein (TIGR01319 family)
VRGPDDWAAGLVLCVDVGSTFTKAAAVGLRDGRLLATASGPTTLARDVLEGVDAVLADLRASVVESAVALAAPDTVTDAARAAARAAHSARVLACSSAGGGLRLAVVGYERAVTAEAGYRVGLSAGAKVVHVATGRLDAEALRALAAATPDLVLLVGGTDGGNSEVLVHNAGALASSPLRLPVVVAGNAAVRDQVVALISATGGTALPAANVLPRIGVLDPLPARAAIREVFIRHVIGGKQLSASPRFAAMVMAATPDAVLAGVELLADGVDGVPDLPGAGDVVVVDVGGATTDVYSVITPDPDQVAAHCEVVETLWRSRTVEGDLGMRWNAPGIVAGAVTEHLVDDAEAAGLAVEAQRRAQDPSWLPDDAHGRAVDARLARLAVTVALRRHARPQDSGQLRTPGKDLRRVRLVVGSGGVLRHGGPAAVRFALDPARSDHAGGWRVPERAALAVDARYVLAAAGLLAGENPMAAARLAGTAVCDLDQLAEPPLER